MFAFAAPSPLAVRFPTALPQRALRPRLRALPHATADPPPKTLSRRALLQATAATALAICLPTAIGTDAVPPAAARPRGLPPGGASAALKATTYDAEWPYSAADFTRYDMKADTEFYATPRITRHIDDAAADALAAFYATLLPDAPSVLDVCSSVEAYVPAKWPGRKRLAALGLNEEEMRVSRAEPDDVVVLDLNATTPLRLPYADRAFDLVTCNVSIDYLTDPRAVLREAARVLRPGGKVAIAFSDRLFFSKAIALWTAGGDDDHVSTVATFLHFAGGFGDPSVVDLSPRKRNGECSGDPLYVVTANRL